MHLSSETAFDFIEFRLGRDEQTFWRQHLEACGECKDDVHSRQQLLTDLKRSHLKSASDHALDKVIELFPRRRGKTRSRVRSVIATLLLDSFRQPALAGARGPSFAAARQFVMRAEEFDVHIKVWGEPQHMQMLGQLLHRQGESFVHAARFHLLCNGERMETVSADEMGEFKFTDVPEGDLSLQIDLPNLTVIGSLKVQED